jgi:hypothetical protein
MDGLNLYGFVVNNPLNNIDPLGEYIKSITVTDVPPDRKKVDIVFRVHWVKTECENPKDEKKLRKLKTQKAFDQKAAEIWSGKFKTKTSPKITYKVTTRFESTYEDAGDPYPEESSTIVLQSTEWASSANRANAFLGAPSKTKFQYSIQLFYGDNVRVYAHEIGHSMGLEDRYKDNSSGYSVPDPGWEMNIMGNHAYDPDYRTIEEIIRIWYTNAP